MIVVGTEEPTVSVQCLHSRLQEQGLVIFDASLNPVGRSQDARSDSAKKRYVPHARIFDLEKVSDQESEFPHMRPSKEEFQTQMRECGVNENDFIVVYDDAGVYSSPRVRFMFRAMGHHNIAVLEGGLPAWVKAGYECVDEPAGMAGRAPLPSTPPGNFVAKPDPAFFLTLEQVDSFRESNSVVLIDARSSDRFQGRVREPRPGLRSGHIPGAVNLPFTEVLKDGFLKKPDELRAILHPYLEGKNQVILSCGSGVTACILALAIEVVGFEKISVYDGSWCEWGIRKL
jgi:thiosulfate/3-mercaptopyruvate sulfurtransferase